MQELINKIQDEPFEVEVQYCDCDPDNCKHDCLIGVNECDSHWVTFW